MKKKTRALILILLSLSVAACSGGGAGSGKSKKKPKPGQWVSLTTSFLEASQEGFNELNPIVGINSDRNYTFTASGPIQSGSESGNQDSVITLEVPGVFSDRETAIITILDDSGNEVVLSMEVFMRSPAPALSSETDTNYNNQNTVNTIIPIEIDIASPYQSIQLIDLDDGGSIRATTLTSGASGLVVIDLNLSVSNVFNGFVRVIDTFGNVTDGPSLNTFRLLGFKYISSGSNNYCAINLANHAYCWGSASGSQLGNGSSTGSSDTPSPVHAGVEGFDPSNVRFISAGTNHTCAIDLSGKLFCWGTGVLGALGRGSSATSTVPVAVHAGVEGFDPNNVKSVATGNFYTCAVDSTNSIYCWGSGTGGVIGNGAGTGSNLPVAVHAGVEGFDPSNVRAIHAKGGSLCAVTLSDQLFCWGAGVNGKLGRGDTENSNLPVAVHAGVEGFDPSNVQAVALGNNHTCAIDLSGKLFCWGSDPDGIFDVIGNGAGTGSNLPVAVHAGVEGFDPSNVQTVALGNNHTCAIMNYGEAFCWGTGVNGVLGNGDQLGSPLPVAVDMSGI